MYKDALELVAQDPSRLKTKIALMNNCAQCFVELKMWSSALEQANLILQSDPDSLKASQVKVMSLAATNSATLAKDFCKDAIRRWPQDQELRRLFEQIKTSSTQMVVLGSAALYEEKKVVLQNGFRALD